MKEKLRLPSGLLAVARKLGMMEVDEPPHAVPAAFSAHDE